MFDRHIADHAGAVEPKPKRRREQAEPHRDYQHHAEMQGIDAKLDRDRQQQRPEDDQGRGSLEHRAHHDQDRDRQQHEQPGAVRARELQHHLADRLRHLLQGQDESQRPNGPLQILVTNLDYSDYLGRLAIARVFNGTLHTGDEVAISKRDGSLEKTKITKLFSFSGLKRTDIEETTLGDIVAVAGISGITIGETITSLENPAPLPTISIDEPTIAMQFFVNNSPFAGREGQYVTSRNLRERLEKELLTNVSIRVEDAGNADNFKVLGRGELQLAILIEMMRREGYELMVGRPEIVTRVVDGKLMEPVELLTIDIPENFVGVVMERLGPRKAEMVKMHNHGYGRVRLEFRIPSRGLIGLRNEMLTETRGTIVMNSLFDGYMPHQGDIPQRSTGALIADRAGTTTTYALDGLQERGVLFLGPGNEVYEGIIVGEHSRDNDLDVNAVREKKLTNMRASSADDAIRLVPFKPQNLEQAIEFINEDELVEVTPKSLRLRKKILQANRRPKKNAVPTSV